CEEIYRHRDFNQKLGIAIIAVGVTLWIWLETFLPMLGAAALDLPARGMHCAGCAHPVEGLLAKVDGVRTVHVNFATEKAHVEGEVPLTAGAY
ncbi:MAG: heavy metal-associated domain-containing protein, partial [Planctomycetota bacterium]